MRNKLTMNLQTISLTSIGVSHFLKSVKQFDERCLSFMSRIGLPILRVGLGLVFFWFGALKLAPGLSPAEGLVRDTVFFLDAAWFVPFLGIWEMIIGLGLVINRYMRVVLLLIFIQMGGTLLPLLVLPEVVWVKFPHVLTIEGQYIIKNVVLIGAALVLGGRIYERKIEKISN